MESKLKRFCCWLFNMRRVHLMNRKQGWVCDWCNSVVCKSRIKIWKQWCSRCEKCRNHNHIHNPNKERMNR